MTRHPLTLSPLEQARANQTAAADCSNDNVETPSRQFIA